MELLQQGLEDAAQALHRVEEGTPLPWILPHVTMPCWSASSDGVSNVTTASPKANSIPQLGFVSGRQRAVIRVESALSPPLPFSPKGGARVIKQENGGPAFSLSLTPIHSLRHRLVVVSHCRCVVQGRHCTHATPHIWPARCSVVVRSRRKDMD